MRFLLAAILLLLLAISASAQWKYPPSKTVDVSDTHFGKTYPDPYRWLEDVKNTEVETWFKNQAALTDATLAKIPGRDALVAEWQAIHRLRPATYWGFVVTKGRVFYKKRLPDEDVGKLYTRERWTGAEKLLLDPSTYKSPNLTAGGTPSIQGMVPSWDGKYVAVGITSGGAEWSELRILDVAKGTLLPDTIYPSTGPVGWTRDGRSFFYDAGKITDITSLEINLDRKTRLHTLGTDVATDPDILSSEANPELNIERKEWPAASIDRSWPDHLVASTFTVQSELKYYVAPASDLKARGKKIGWKPLCQASDKLVRGIAFHGDSAYAITYAGAPRYKLVRTSVKKPDWAGAEVVLPEAADTIQHIEKSKGFLLVEYSNGVVSRLVKYDLAARKASEVKLPVSGSAYVHCPDPGTDRCLVVTSTWTDQTRIYDLDVARGTLERSVFDTATAVPGFDQLVTEEVEVPSHDGAMVPLTIIYRKGLKLDGSNPAIMKGYGAYGIGYTPNFDPRHSLALHGVVLAYAHVRGGGQKGEAWYRGGFKATKPNTWKDFIACAEYLVKKGYTSPARLGGTGKSAGGILISRAITERPDLFGAAVCNVGVANALRAELTANGPANIPEFGTVANEGEVRWLYEMDGVQHVKKGVKYPALLGVAGWNDPRVTPWQTAKLVAAMQNASASGKPALMKVNFEGGHFTEELLATLKNQADQDAFLLWQTGHPDFQPRDEQAPLHPPGSP